MELLRDEIEWLKTNIEKLGRHKERVLSSSYYGTNEKNFDALVTKVTEATQDPGTGMATIKFTRNDLRLVQKILKPAVVNLEAKVLPAYKQRAKSDQNKYRPYVLRTEDMITLLRALSDTIESEL